MAPERDRLILCYHAVSATWARALSVTPERFEEQIELLTRRGYEGSTFTRAATESLGDRQSLVAITFDDAYRSVFEVAKPILDRYGMIATVFVPTALMGIEAPMRWPEIEHWTDATDDAELVPMSWDELAQLAEAGWEIGAHGRTHPRMTDLDDRRLAEELAGSKSDLERELGRPCRSIAYPFGAFDARVAAAAGANGFEAAATLAPGRPDPATSLTTPRVGVYLGDAGWRFRLKISRIGPRLAAARAPAGRDGTAQA